MPHLSKSFDQSKRDLSTCLSDLKAMREYFLCPIFSIYKIDPDGYIEDEAGSADVKKSMVQCQ